MNQQIGLVPVVTSQANAESAFWLRVREHKELGLVPAGQVDPPPQPKKVLVETAA